MVIIATEAVVGSWFGEVSYGNMVVIRTNQDKHSNFNDTIMSFLFP